VKIPWVRKDLCGSKVVVMEWIDGIRCTDVDGESWVEHGGGEVGRPANADIYQGTSKKGL
jgi:hypothetical protein